MPLSNLRIVADSRELAHIAVEEYLRKSRDAVNKHGRFRVALSGGSTPTSLYQLLADPAWPYVSEVPWSWTDFFWTDERHVPPDHPDSNFRMANEAMLIPARVPAENIHRIKTENGNTTEVARDYENTLRKVFSLTKDQFPRFDVILLGMGIEGHTASIFPGSPVLKEKRRLAAATYVEKLKTNRITLTIPVLNNADLILFLVSGPEKSDILRTVLEHAPNPNQYPAQAIKPLHGELLWLVDRAAASELRPPEQALKTA